MDTPPKSCFGASHSPIHVLSHVRFRLRSDIGTATLWQGQPNDRSGTITLEAKLEVLALLGNGAVLALILYRRIYRSLPFFSGYLLFLLIVSAVAHVFTSSGLFPALSVVDAALIFFVLCELAISVLKPVESSVPDWTPFAVSFVILMVYAVIWQFVSRLQGLALFSQNTARQICLELSCTALQIVFFVALAAFSQATGIGRRSRQFKIAAGFGLFSFVNCLVMSSQMRGETRDAAAIEQYHLLDEVRGFAAVCLMLYWVICFAREERHGEPAGCEGA